ncbi:MAG: hypothetical protein NTW95_05400 [Candidatus Aminicenantes bacterium]|nr:hypothetical protein [Candidatus Aminicenantes bacterium]
MKKMTLVASIALFILVPPLRAQINLLHEFAGGNADGKNPTCDLLISGSTIFGTTSKGGKSDNGTVFKMQTNGTGYTLLHSFSGGTADGRDPAGSLIISGSTLYGMTPYGGKLDRGTIFKMETDGNGYTLLHSFVGAPDDGQYPNDNLILSGSTLYGTTAWGGHSDNGTIFKIQTDGSGFTLLHEFPGVYAYGSPSGSLLLSESILYGMTYLGGDNHLGAVFKIQTNGSGFTFLYSFFGQTGLIDDRDGQKPGGSLVLSGSTLFGMTSGGGVGGVSGYGTIFKVQTDGTGYKLLHEFPDNAAEGRYPMGSLILCGSTLFGMAQSGGINDFGTLFNIETDGSGFTLQHKFVGGADDGAHPLASLVLSGSTLYGTTFRGGDSNIGVIFSLPLPIHIMTVLAERQELKAFSILRQYGQIQFTVEISNIPASYYCILRRKGSGDFVLLRTIAPSELQNNRFQMQDKYLDKGIPYTYRVEAYNISGQLVGLPEEKTI